MIVVPPGLRGLAKLGDTEARWLDRLPELCANLGNEWNLTATGPAISGNYSLVLPVIVVETGEAAALKLTMPTDVESLTEHLALRQWAGNGTVRLLRAEPSRRALLLEWAGPEDLSETWDVEACEIAGQIARRLHIPPLPQFEPLAVRVLPQIAKLEADRAQAPIPPRLVTQAITLARELLEAPPTAVIHGDLHYGNILRSARGDSDPELEWLAIDPKPANGDPAYDVEPLLRNRFDEYGSAVRWGVRNRFGVITEAAGLDEDRARAWVIVRSILGAHWAWQDDGPESNYLTTCITIAKAVQG